MRFVLYKMQQGQAVRQSSITYSTYLNGEPVRLSTMSALANRLLVKKGELIGTDYDIVLTEAGKRKKL